AAWSEADWSAHPQMIANTAEWVAEEAAAFGIPLVALTAQQAQGGASGVCQHADLGASGGGHWDCGYSFPMARVLELAGGGGAPAPTQKEERRMVLTDQITGGLWVLMPDGGVHTYDGA